MRLGQPIEAKPAGIDFEGMTLGAFVVDSVRSVSTEFLVYDAGSLAGDVGGMLGMLLGASFLTLYDSALSGLKKAAKMMKQP